MNDFVNPTNFPSARFTDLGSITNLITPLLSIGGGIIFLVMLFYAGFTVLTAGGKTENLEKARNIATYAVIGLLVIMFGYLIVKVLAIILNVQDKITL